MLANEAIPLAESVGGGLKKAQNIGKFIQSGEMLLVPGFPQELDELIDPIWEHTHIQGWVSDDGGLKDAPKLSGEFLALVDKNLSRVEDRLKEACNNAAKLWCRANLAELQGISPDLPGLVA